MRQIKEDIQYSCASMYLFYKRCMSASFLIFLESWRNILDIQSLRYTKNGHSSNKKKCATVSLFEHLGQFSHQINYILIKKEFNSLALFFSPSLMVQTFSTADGFMMKSKAFFGQFLVDPIKTDTDVWVL